MDAHWDNRTRLASIERAIHGDQAERRHAFDDIVASYQGFAQRYAYQLLRDHHLAEDAVQEAFLVAYLRIDQLREATAFWSWFKRVIFTQCDRMVRGVQPVLEPIETRYDLADDAPAPEDEVAQRELRQRIRRAIASLPEHERTVTESYYMQGQSQREIANELKIPLTTVKKRLQYAREHLRMLVGGINAVFDHAIADWLHTDTDPQQPAYAYQTHISDDDPRYYDEA